MNRRQWLTRWTACCALQLSLQIGAHAQSESTSESAKPLQDVQIGFFGTLSAYRGDAKEVAVRPSERAKHLSQDGQWRGDGDSILGTQLRWLARDNWEAVWQVQLREDLVEGYHPSTEWAYLGWRPDPDWQLRLGRQPLPIFLLSETRRIGFAQTTVRPMSAIYGLNGNEPVDGFNASWSPAAWGGSINLDLGAGKNRVALPRGQVDTRALIAGALRWQREGLALRLGLAAFRFDLRDAALQAQLSRVQAPDSACSNCAHLLPQRARTQGIEGQIYNLAVNWEQGAWTLSAEAMMRQANSVLGGDLRAWYALLSRRFGALTPYVSLGASRHTEGPLGLQASAGSAAAVSQALALLDRSLQTPFDRRIELAGLRWDWHEKAALKVQIERWTATRDRSTPRDGEIRLSAGSPPWDGQVSLTTVSLDFVF